MVAAAVGRGLADPERRAWIVDAIDHAGIDGIVAWRPEELVVCTGVAPHLGMTLALIDRDGRGVLYRPRNEPDDLIGEGLADRRYVAGQGSTASSDFADLMRDDMRALGLVGGRLGVAGETPRSAPNGNAAEGGALTTELVRGLVREAGAADVADAQPMFARLMLRKTRREVAALRRVHAVAAFGLDAFHDGLAAGRTEAELAALVETAVASRTGREGAGQARAWANVQAGPNSSLAGTYSRSSGRPLEPGDLAVLEMAAVVDGMWCDLTRTGTVGPPSSSQAALLASVRDAQLAAAHAAVPDASHADVDSAARRRMEDHGLADGFSHATGHHVGFRYHDPGPLLAPGSDEPLEPGMVIAIEPGTYSPRLGGARLEDNFLITSAGAVALSASSLVAS